MTSILKHIFSLVLAGYVTVLLGCTATQQIIKPAEDLVAKGDLNGAYDAITEAHREHPSNRKIAEVKKRIANSIAHQYLKKFEELPFEDLVSLRFTLQNALKVESDYTDKIHRHLEQVEKQIAEITNKAEASMKAEDVLHVLETFWSLKHYAPFISPVEELKKHLGERIGEIPVAVEEKLEDKLYEEAVHFCRITKAIWPDAKLLDKRMQNAFHTSLDKLEGANEVQIAIVLCRIVQDVWPGDNTVTKTMNNMVSMLDSNLKALSNKYEVTASDERYASALFYDEVGRLYSISEPLDFAKVNRAVTRLKDTYSVTPCIEFLGAFSNEQKKYFVSLFKDAQNLRVTKPVHIKSYNKEPLGDFLVRVELQDIAIERERSRSTPYSKYFAGYRNELNPEYNRLAMEHQKALNLAQMMASMGNAFGSSLCYAKAAGITNQMAQTPQFVKVQVFSDYQYLKEENIFCPYIKVRYTILDLKDKMIFESDEIERRGNVRRTVIDGVHPNDANYLRNQGLEHGEQRSILESFIREQMKDIVEKISKVSNLSLIYRAKDSFSEGYHDSGMDYLIAYILLNRLNERNAVDEMGIANLGVDPILKIVDKVFLHEKSKKVVEAKEVISPEALCKSIILLSVPPDNGLIDIREILKEWSPVDFVFKSKTALIDKRAIIASSVQRPTISQCWAVIIGLSNYHDSRIPPLRYAAADAQSFYTWLISPEGGRYPPSQVRLMVNEYATLRNIKEALFVWLKQAIEEDMVIIFFAGHGSPESPDSTENLFLLPYDAQYDSIATTCFPMWDIETALKRFVKAKKVVVIADACHSGGVGEDFDIARRANRGIKVNPISSGLQNLSKVGDGVCVISASDDKQFSQESQEWGGGHGVFTYFLLKGLKGKADYNQDKRITLGELIPFLSEQVRRATMNAQSPTVAGKFDPALSIGK